MGNIKTLVIEDDLDFIEICETVLGKKNIDISNNMSEALELAGKYKYAHYITDGSFPLRPSEKKENRACIYFIEKLKTIHPDAEITIISTNALDYAREARPLGVRNFIPNECCSLSKRVEIHSKLLTLIKSE